MPVYVYKTPDGRMIERRFSAAKRPDRLTLPDGSEAVLDVAAWAGTVGCSGTSRGTGRVVLSRALGVPPWCVKEARMKEPHHEFLDDGRLVIRPGRKQDVLKRLDAVDMN